MLRQYLNNVLDESSDMRCEKMVWNLMRSKSCCEIPHHRYDVIAEAIVLDGLFFHLLGRWVREVGRA